MDKATHPLEHPDWPKVRDFQLPNFPSTVPAQVAGEEES